MGSYLIFGSCIYNETIPDQMNKTHFIKLLQKYLQGNATQQERQFLMSYYELFDAEPDVVDAMNDEQKEVLKNQIKDSIWQSIDEHEQQAQKTTISLYKGWFKIIPVAAIIFAICITGIVFIFNKSQIQENNITKTIQEKENQLIRLPDGSLVIIRTGSKLHYPHSFDDLVTREVYLEGQAYFDVKHDPSKPFIVHTGSLKTTVLGTAFNIKAWPAEVDVSVTVTRGKVKVGNQNKIIGTLVEDQQLTFIKEKADVIQKDVKARTYLSWKEQDLLIDDVTISEAAELLGDRFDVNITCSEEVIRSERFTLTILKDESLEQVLSSICEFNNADYHYDKEKASVIIDRKSKSPL